MKKKMFLVLVLVLILCLMSGCSILSGNRLESMFGNSTTGGKTISANSSADNVTISRDEYEDYLRLQKFSELADLYDVAQTDFYQEPDSDKMLEYAAKGLMAGLDDPFSFYYSPEEFKQMYEDDEGKYVGIGVMILGNVKDDTCVISRVFKGSPAEEAGVMRGDVLYRVEDDFYVTPENLTEAVKIMRGEPGTVVNVTFLRDEEEITFQILRKEIMVNQVESTLLETGIGYIAMYEFAGEAEKEFEKALNELLEQGIKGVIIDLRDNSGGWVEQARYIGDLFMDKGELCYLVFRDGTENHEYYRTKDGKADVKIVVLINEMSASSSEILTGALRDCADATIVGTTSYGKGIVQNVYPIGSNGAGYQITIAEYFSPKGNKVHKIGISPDVVVERPDGDKGIYEFADTSKDVQLVKALEIMREKLK